MNIKINSQTLVHLFNYNFRLKPEESRNTILKSVFDHIFKHYPQFDTCIPNGSKEYLCPANDGSDKRLLIDPTQFSLEAINGKNLSLTRGRITCVPIFGKHLSVSPTLYCESARTWPSNLSLWSLAFEKGQWVEKSGLDIRTSKHSQITALVKHQLLRLDEFLKEPILRLADQKAADKADFKKYLGTASLVAMGTFFLFRKMRRTGPQTDPQRRDEYLHAIVSGAILTSIYAMFAYGMINNSFD